MASTPIDVLIAGAGPTGLMLAVQLARRGHRPLIVDRHPGPARESRALVVQPRTLELYAHLGLAERALALGTRAVAASMWVEGRRAARVPFGDIGQGLSPFPFLLILSQDENERLLGDALRGFGLDVQWNTELVAVDRAVSAASTGADLVTATLRHADGTSAQVHTRYLAGCDGARSDVRTRLGIDFAGAPYEQVFFVADTRAQGPMTPGEMNVYIWPDGFHLFFPMRGEDRWRVIGILPPALRGRDDVGLEDVLPSLRANAGDALAFQECLWFSTYRIHHRRAARFRDGRCFLLGDAAHVHSPVGAQGMNTGLQDAYNLGWKLALALSGRLAPAAADALLDTYAAERVPVAERLLRTTDQAFRIVVSSRGLAGFVRTQVAPRGLALAMRSGRVRRLAFRTISQIGIRYPKSPLSQVLPGLATGEMWGGPVAGERFPWLELVLSAGGQAEDLFARLDDTRFCLLVFGQSLPAGFVLEPADLFAIHVVPDDPANERELKRARVPRPSFYLLRPDGHVGLAGSRFDAEALARYLSERVGLSGGEQRASRMVL